MQKFRYSGDLSDQEYILVIAWRFGELCKGKQFKDSHSKTAADDDHFGKAHQAFYHSKSQNVLDFLLRDAAYKGLAAQ